MNVAFEGKADMSDRSRQKSTQVRRKNPNNLFPADTHNGSEEKVLNY
jgi:hypothetical protein